MYKAIQLFLILILYRIVLSLIKTFGDTEEGRLRLYQTADVIILYTNGPMGNTWGVCNRRIHDPDTTQAAYPAIIMAGAYSKLSKQYYR